MSKGVVARPKWLEWGRSLFSLAQSGLTYSTNPFDIERYQEIREIAAEILGCYTGVDVSVMREMLGAQVGYATPKIDVRGVVFVDNKILLVQEVVDDNRWTLPGGWADLNDSPSRAVEREVEEESGYRVQARKLLMVQDRDLHHVPTIFHTYKLFFLCELLGGEPATSIETGGAEFFSRDDIPELSLPRITPEQIKRLFYHHDNPETPADFD